MEEKKKKCCGSQKIDVDKASQNYSGVAINQGDDNKSGEKLEKGYTKILNNNPRNNDE